MTTSLPSADEATSFHDSTHLVGWASEVPAAGDYLTRDLGSAAVLICRGDDGRLNAFLNVCSHEGARVALGCGTAERFVCRRHGWTYDRAGTVVYRPGAIQGPIKLGGRPLRSLPVLEVEGLVLLSTRPGAEVDASAVSLPEYLSRDWRTAGQRGVTLSTRWDAARDVVRSLPGFTVTPVGAYTTLLLSDDELLLVTAGPGQLDGEALVAITLLVHPDAPAPDEAKAAERASSLEGLVQQVRGLLDLG